MVRFEVQPPQRAQTPRPKSASAASPSAQKTPTSTRSCGRPLTIRKGDRIAKEGFTVTAIRSGEVVFRRTAQNRTGQTLTQTATLRPKNPGGCP